MQAMIRTDALSFSYPVEEGQRRTTALEDVTLSIEKGSFVVVLGHNGSGKSTLAKHFNAVLLPSGGAVYVEGMNTQDEDLLLEIRRRVGMVFQNPDNQIVANVVEEDVAFAPENLGVPTAEIRRRVDDALAAVGMTEFARHAPHLLSGGQKQRVAIAGVIAMEPRCIVLDEPTAMLDPIGRADVLRTIRTLNREKGITVVLITHHMDEAAQADRLVVMSKGKVIADGAPKEVFQDVEGLKAVVNALGGVEYDVDREIKLNGRVLHKGVQRLDGQQVLDYCRARKGYGTDVDRADRQQRMLFAIFTQLREGSRLTSIPKLYLSVKDYIYTDLTAEQIAALAVFGMDLVPGESLVRHTLKGKYISGTAYNGASFYVLDTKALKSLMKDIFGVDIKVDYRYDYRYIQDKKS